jgi:hypothetical protein
LPLSRVDKVNMPFINELTLKLRRQAAECKGDYSGWETFVIKD